MDIKFTEKVAVVTGASAGIGEATAILFAKCGAKLSLVGRNEENLQRVADVCKKESGLAPLVIVADLGTDEGCEKVANETLQHFGRVDILINSAGIGCRSCIEQGTAGLADWEKVVATNVRGVYHLTALLVPALKETRGNVVNISSVSSSMASVGSLPYSMSKAALNQFTQCIALELAPSGVRVNTVSPGFTVSRFVPRLTNYTDEQYQGWLNEVKHGIPMGKVCESEDIANTIAFVASERAALMTGCDLVVDGGLKLAGAGFYTTVMTRQIKK